MTPQQPAPHGITLIDHAEIAAEIAEGGRAEEEILAARRITPGAWLESTQHWMTRMADDVREHGADAVVAIVYSEAFARAQDALRPPPAITPEEWAALQVAIQLEGDVGGPLAARGMSLADYLRLGRSMARTLVEDAEAGRRFAEAFQALQDQGG